MTSPVDTAGISPILDENPPLVGFTGFENIVSGITAVDSPFAHLPVAQQPAEPNTASAEHGLTLDAGGKVADGLSAALSMLGTPYVWGGSSKGTGVDCSGLVYMFLQAAGAKTGRFRAKDYSHMGAAVSLQDARPGDIVYFDNPGDVDHVGIYLGNGMFLQAPQTGDVVKISPVHGQSSIRRILGDNAWAGMHTDPAGRFVYNYGSTTYRGGG